jgi:DNA-binding transcriptional ArsR family regulator
VAWSEREGEEAVDKQGRQSKTNLNEQFSLVISHETTVKVMTVLSDGGIKSPKDVGERLEVSTPKASHHIKKLKRLGLAELVEEREVGGTIQHYYRAVMRPIVSDQDWDKLTIPERQLYSVWIVQLILADLAKSFDAECFDAVSNNHLSRTPLMVDKEGLAEVAAIQTKALHDSFQVEARSAERGLRSGKEQGMQIISAMMCFPLPDSSEGPRPRKDL